MTFPFPSLHCHDSMGRDDAAITVWNWIYDYDSEKMKKQTSKNQHPTVSTVIEHVIINIAPVSVRVEMSFELNDMRV